jgi:hypothetical protein
MQKYGGKGKERVAGVVVTDTEQAERGGSCCEGKKDKSGWAEGAWGAGGGMVHEEGGCRSNLCGGFQGRVKRSCGVMHGE